MDTSAHSVDIILEFYRQAVANMRVYVELRFKHFTTFMVITGLLGAVTFRVPAVAIYRRELAVLGAIITVLFWMLDYRTYQLFRVEKERVAVFERALNHGCQLLLPSGPRQLFRASFVTNVIFTLVCVAWILLAWISQAA